MNECFRRADQSAIVTPWVSRIETSQESVFLENRHLIFSILLQFNNLYIAYSRIFTLYENCIREESPGVSESIVLQSVDRFRQTLNPEYLAGFS